MHCPKCNDIKLKPTKLEDRLLAMGCEKCKGAFVSLLYYRDWVESSATAIHPVTESIATDTTYKAMPCPKCRMLMLKYRITGHTHNRLDLCASCDEAWLDGGEWELLKSLDLSHKLPLLFTEIWQNRVRKEVIDESRKQEFLKILGHDDLEKAENIRQWVNAHPHKAKIIRYFSYE